jgi:transcription initiation factor TFIIB
MSQKINSEIIIQIKCETCDGDLIFDSDTNEKICASCGIVISAMYEIESKSHLSMKYMDHGAAEQHTNHMMYDVSLPSFIGEKNIDVNGKRIDRFHSDKMRRLDRRTISNDPKIRNLNKAVREIRRITEILGMKMLIAERASYIYKKAFGQGLIRGRSISGIAAAAIYVACKELDIPHSVDEIENLIENVNKKNVLRYYKLLLKQMRLNVGLPNPIAHLSRISERARLSGRTERKAIEILSKVGTDSTLVGKKPISIAAAALYLASLQTKERTTQLRIAIASELTTITIRKRCVEIMQILEKSKPQIPVEPIKTDSSVMQMPVMIEQAIGPH